MNQHGRWKILSEYYGGRQGGHKPINWSWHLEVPRPSGDILSPLRSSVTKSPSFRLRFSNFFPLFLRLVYAAFIWVNIEFYRCVALKSPDLDLYAVWCRCPLFTTLYFLVLLSTTWTPIKGKLDGSFPLMIISIDQPCSPLPSFPSFSSHSLTAVRSHKEPSVPRMNLCM